MEVLFVNRCPDLPSPERASQHAAGFDLRAAVDQETVLEPGRRLLIPTGLSLAIPHGFEGQVRPRSGLALKHGISIVNAPGTIDSDYRGEVGVILINLGEHPFAIARGDRIAQLVIAAVPDCSLRAVDSLEETTRGSGGFGSTGTGG